MKRVFSFISICFIFIFILGCNGNKSETSSYPKKPVEVIVAFSAGGETDSIARLLFKHAEKHFDKNFVIINKPGASGEIAWTEAANTRPDGYTLVFINPPTFVSHPVQKEKTKYKIKDFRIVANIVADPACIVVKADSEINSLDDLYNKAKASSATIGYSGPGTSEALSLRQMEEITGISIDKIPYSGSAPSIVALLGGHIDAAIMNVSGAINHTRNNAIKVIGVAMDNRVEDYPDVKTFKEQGIAINNVGYRGLAFQKDVPEEIVKKIEKVIKETLKDKEFIAQAKDMQIPLKYLNGEEYTKVINEIYAELTEETKKGEW